MNVFKLFGEISIDKSGAIKGIKEVEGQASKSSLAMQKTFNKLAKVAKVAMIAGAVAATAAIIKMTKDSIKAFAEFEEGMNEVFTLLPDITEEAMDSMKEDVKSLAKEMGILPDEIVPALYQAISAGIPAENVFDFMRVASTAAIGGVTDLETAVDGLTSIINAYGRENMTARDAADILFTAVRLGKTTMEELSDRLFQVNPIAAALGVSFEDVAAAMAEITAAGVPTRVAATQLRQMFMELSKAGSDVALTFEHVAGMSFQDFIAEGNNVGDALQLLTDYAEENDIKMQDMFGSVEAGQAVLALTGTHLDSYTAKIAEMDNAAGAADAAHEKMEGGLKRTWAKIQAWWATVKINLGEKLQAPLERLLTWIEDHQEDIEDGITSIFEKLISAAEWLMDNSDKVAKGLKAIAIGFAAIIAIKFGLWIAPVISSISHLTLAIGTKVGVGAGLIGALGVLGTALAATAAIVLVYNQKTGESADITRDLTDETIELMELDWLKLREDILEIGEAAGMTEEDLFALTDALETAFLAAIEAPDPAEASRLWAQYTDAILAEWEIFHVDRVTLEETTGEEILQITEDTNVERTRSIIENTRIRQAIAAAAAATHKALIAEEKEDIYSLGDAWEDFGVGLKKTFESSVLKFFQMFRDNTITIGSIVTNFVDDAISEIERLAAKWTAEHVWAWLTGGAVQPLNLGSLATAWDWLAGVFSGFGGWLGVAGAAILLFSGKLDGAIAAVGNFIGSLWSGITGFFGGIWDWLFGGGGGETPVPPSLDTLEVFRGQISSLAERAAGMASVTSLASEIDALAERGRALGISGVADPLNIAHYRALQNNRSALVAALNQAAAAFAAGGLVSSPILSLIGEGPQKEAVLPLSKPVFRELGQGIIEALTSVIAPQAAMAVAGGGGEITINIDNLAVREEADVPRIAAHMMELVEDERRAQGRDSLIGG